MTVRLLVRAIGLGLARRLGSTVVDRRTGQVLGRALFLPWRGRIMVVGLGEQIHPVRAVFLPQERLTYWKQEIGFTTLPEPDFPSEATEGEITDPRATSFDTPRG